MKGFVLMKIGIDGRAAIWYRGTGIGTYTYELLEAFNNIDDINNYMIYIAKDYNLDINLNNNFSEIEISSKLKNNFWNSINSSTPTNSSIDLYHNPQNGIGATLPKTCPLVITLHDIIPIKLPETVGSIYLDLFNKQMSSIISNCDGIITVSNFSKDDISSCFNFPKEKIFVTPLASEKIYKPLNKNYCKDFIKKVYGISDDFILYVGGFSPRKNIIGLIDAYSKAIPNIPQNTKLVILGKHGISYELYKKRVSDLNLENNVLFPGFIPPSYMPLFYNAAELFVYPSFYEGFGLPPLEAMACGTPVICSNVTSIPEVVGDAAILINPNDMDNLKNSIAEVLTNPELKHSLIKKGIFRNSMFTWNNTAHSTLLAYNNIMNNL